MPHASRTVNKKHLTIDWIKKTVNCQLSTVNCLKRQGFTLIEFLVVLGLLVLTVSSTLFFLTSVLKGSNHANVTAEAKQNGQAVLGSLESQIRNANNAYEADPTHIYLAYENSTNFLHIKCFTGTSNQNGWIGIANDSGTNPADPSYISITNQDPIGGVDIEGPCSLTVLPATTGGVSPAVVSVSFTVNQGVSAPSRKDYVANLQMQTSISLRNYTQ